MNLGFQENVKGYRLWDIHERKIIVSRDIVFEEENFPYKNKISTEENKLLQSKEVEVELNNDEMAEEEIELPDIQLNIQENIEDNIIQEVLQDAENEEIREAEIRLIERQPINDNIPELRRSTREKKARLHTCCHVEAIIYKDPQTVEEALNREDHDKWKEAMDQEMEAIRKNRTWILVRRLENANIIGCKWVFRRKQNEDGTIGKFKARLVAQGYN